MTSPFPIKILRTSLHFKRGSSDKEYHLIKLTTADDRSLLIKRWGKAGSWGQMDFYRGDSEAVSDLWNKVYREKTGKGYQVKTSGSSLSVKDLPELRNTLGSGYFFKLGDHLQYLIPGADTKGQVEHKNPEWEQTADGRYIPKSEPGRRAIAPAAPKTLEERYADNPAWGMF